MGNKDGDGPDFRRCIDPDPGKFRAGKRTVGNKKPLTGNFQNLF